MKQAFKCINNEVADDALIEREAKESEVRDAQGNVARIEG